MSSQPINKKLHAKVFFYAKHHKSSASSMEAPSNQTKSKSDEIRKICLYDTFQEFQNRVMLSIDSPNNDEKQYFSDPTPSKKNYALTFKYLDAEKDWISFANEEEYQNALQLAQTLKQSLRVKVYYKKSKKSKSKSDHQSNSFNHCLTVSIDHQKLQQMLKDQSNQEGFFGFWKEPSLVKVDA